MRLCQGIRVLMLEEVASTLFVGLCGGKGEAVRDKVQRWECAQEYEAGIGLILLELLIGGLNLVTKAIQHIKRKHVPTEQRWWVTIQLFRSKNKCFDII